MKAPYGDFVVRTSADRADVVLIAGGTGVTPFVAFMEEILAKGLEGSVWLHYGARHEDLLVFRDFAARCVGRFPAFHADFYAEAAAGPAVISGQIDLERAFRSVPDGRQATYYLCGPQPMINAFRSRLTREFGVAEADVKIDQWE